MEALTRPICKSVFLIPIFMAFIATPTQAEVINYSPQPVYRLYNESTGAHLLTADWNEVSTLAGAGWKNEAVAFYMPSVETPEKIYRLYNPNNQDHHFTRDENEYKSLQKVGWSGEGVAFFGSTSVLHPVYRLYNTKLTQGSHLWTTDDNEYKTLPEIAPDWVRESEAFYADSLTNPTFTYEGQKLDLPSIANSRQLGGYVMPNGKKIKNNMLIRSAALGKLTKEDKQKLQNVYNLKEVIDFRAEEEAKSAADILPEGANYHLLPALDSGAIYDTETLMAMMEAMSSSDPNAGSIALAKHDGLKQIYQKLLLSEQGKNAYRGFFEALLANARSENPGAVLWHCSQGKDRAGIASALVLAALGADDATIRRDYSFTCQSYQAETEALLPVAKENNLNDEETRELLGIAGNAYPEYLQLAMNCLYDNYGYSLEGYLMDVIGLSQADLIALQDAYLE